MYILLSADPIIYCSDKIITISCYTYSSTESESAALECGKVIPSLTTIDAPLLVVVKYLLLNILEGASTTFTLSSKPLCSRTL